MVYALLNAGALAIGHLWQVNRDFPMFGSTPLQYALLKPEPILVEALLNKGASVKEIYNFDNKTTLMRASKGTLDDVVKVLLKQRCFCKGCG